MSSSLASSDLTSSDFANPGLDRRDAYSPYIDAEPQPPILDAQREAVLLAANPPIRVRLGAERERGGRALAQVQARACFDPLGLLGGRGVPLHVERGDRIERRRTIPEPAAARVGDRIRVGHVRLDVEHGRAVEHVDVADVQREAVDALETHGR